MNDPFNKNRKRVKLKSILIFCVIVCQTHFLYAQQSKFGNWVIYFGNQKITKKCNWWNEVQLRNYDFIGDVQQLLLRTGVGYDLKENSVNILMGYAHVSSYNYLSASDNKTVSTENRIYQQLTLKNRFDRIFISHRYRTEQRFFKNDFKFRFRYFLSCNIPINKSEMKANALYASFYNEIFIQGKTPFFDRNRAYAALGYVINPDFKIELGYMNQMLEKSSRNQLQIVIFNSMPFCKD
ncbi:MAG: hypothetical protein RL582_753 [Bacteroidota bacterium]|jgi:hypothetical protein